MATFFLNLIWGYMKTIRSKILAPSLLMVHAITLSNIESSKIEIINNTDQSLKFTHNLPDSTKATITFTSLDKVTLNNEYILISLPEEFLSSDDGHSLNNLGQVAGSIKDAKAQPFKPNPKNQWHSPLQMPSEKVHGYQAAVWSLANNLITSKLKNSRAVALNDSGFVAISQGSDLPNPSVLWDINTDDFESWTAKDNIGKRKIKVSIYDHMTKIADSNEKKSSLSIVYNPFDPQSMPELRLVNSGKFNVIPFEQELDVNTKRLKTALPIVNARLNDNDKVVVMVKVNGKQAIGSWGKKEGTTVSGCLEDNPHFKGFTNFAIAGFNNQGHILLRADVNKPNELEYKPIKPRMYLLMPKI